MVDKGCHELLHLCVFLELIEQCSILCQERLNITLIGQEYDDESLCRD